MTFPGVALAPVTGFTVGGSRNVEVRASGDGGHVIVMSLAVCVTTGGPGAELPASSGTDATGRRQALPAARTLRHHEVMTPRQLRWRRGDERPDVFLRRFARRFDPRRLFNRHLHRHARVGGQRFDESRPLFRDRRRAAAATAAARNRWRESEGPAGSASPAAWRPASPFLAALRLRAAVRDVTA